MALRGGGGTFEVNPNGKKLGHYGMLLKGIMVTCLLLSLSLLPGCHDMMSLALPHFLHHEALPHYRLKDFIVSNNESRQTFLSFKSIL